MFLNLKTHLSFSLFYQINLLKRKSYSFILNKTQNNLAFLNITLSCKTSVDILLSTSN